MNCWGCQADVTGSNFCPACGKLQPAENEDRDYYRALGFAEPLLNLDPAKLEQTFHARSRLFHPDRFQRSDPKELAISLERSALLNDAYRTLRDKRARVRYVVERFGEASSSSHEVPKELAEIYFDLQEVLSDPGATERLNQLKDELQGRRTSLGLRLEELSSAWDRGGDRRSIPGELRALLHQENYLNSMLRDLGRSSGETRDGR